MGDSTPGEFPMYLAWFDLPENLRSQISDMIAVARDEGRFNDLLTRDDYQYAVLEVRTGTVLASDLPDPSERALTRLPRIGTVNVPRELAAT